MDVFGDALLDFYKLGKAEVLLLHTSYGEPEEMPVDIFFRTVDEMPELETLALDLCKGRVLDVGAGVGSHSLLLQEMGIDVTALDISPKAVQIMKNRGVKKVVLQDLFKLTDTFDTLLFLMNGIGLTGTLPRFAQFLHDAKKMLRKDGQLIFDSSNIAYLYEDIPRPENRYFGEVSYCYEYRGQKENFFDWLYIDEGTLSNLAEQHGWNCEIVFQDGEDQYLAKLTMV